MADKKQTTPKEFCEGVFKQYDNFKKRGFKVGNTSVPAGAWERCKKSFPRGSNATAKAAGGSRRRKIDTCKRKNKRKN